MRRDSDVNERKLFLSKQSGLQKKTCLSACKQVQKLQYISAKKMFVLSYYLCALFFSDALMMNHFIKYSVCTLKSIFKVHPSPRFMYMQQSQALISTAFYWQHRQCETFCITAKAKCPSLCLLIRIFRVGSLRSSPPSQNK